MALPESSTIPILPPRMRSELYVDCRFWVFLLRAVRFQIFNSRLEALDLILSLGLLLLSASEAFLNVSFGSVLVGGRQWTIVQDVFFLKNGHVVFTFLFMFNTQEGREWIRQTKDLNILPRVAFVFVGAMIGGAVLVTMPHTEWSLLSSFLFIVAGKHHQIQQCRGIQKIYEANFNGELRRGSGFARALYGLDATIWSGLTASSAIALFLSQNMGGSESRLRGREILLSTLGRSVDGVLKMALAVCGFFLVLLFIRTILCYRPGLATRLCVRHLRHVMFLLVSGSDVAAFGSASMHGIESLCVAEKLNGKTRRLTSGWRFLFYLIFGGGFLVVLHYPGLFLPFSIDSRRWPFAILPAVVAGLSFVHFLLDSMLFSGAVKASRSLVLGRLVERSGSERT